MSEIFRFTPNEELYKKKNRSIFAVNRINLIKVFVLFFVDSFSTESVKEKPMNVKRRRRRSCIKNEGKFMRSSHSTDFKCTWKEWKEKKGKTLLVCVTSHFCWMVPNKFKSPMNIKNTKFNEIKCESFFLPNINFIFFCWSNERKFFLFKIYCYLNMNFSPNSVCQTMCAKKKRNRTKTR